MASELSRLIDDELEKVERQQGEIDGKRLKTSFQIKGPEKAAQSSWRSLDWWLQNRRFVFAACGGLVVLFTLWLLFAKPSTNSATAYFSKTSNAPEAVHHSESSFASPLEQTVAGLLAPSIGSNSSFVQKGIATEQEGVNSKAPSPELDVVVSTSVEAPNGAVLVSDSPSTAPSPVEEIGALESAEAPEQDTGLAESPIEEGVLAPSELQAPAAESNATKLQPKGGLVKPNFGNLIGRHLRLKL